MQLSLWALQVTLPDGRASQVDQWRTYNEEAKDKVCQGAACVAYGVIECVKANAQALGKSWGENIGCYNSGVQLPDCGSEEG